MVQFISKHGGKDGRRNTRKVEIFFSMPIVTSVHTRPFSGEAVCLLERLGSPGQTVCYTGPSEKGREVIFKKHLASEWLNHLSIKF